MAPSIRVPLAASALLLLGGGVLAQQQTDLTAATLSSSPIPIHAFAGDEGPEIWAAGRAYKVSFHDGATFIPYLGEHYPVNQPWRWRTTSVRAGARELLQRAGPPATGYGPARFEYDLGPCVEAYEVGSDGLEQSFVFTRAAGVVGDLVVSGRIDTALQCPATVGMATALEFVDAQGVPILRYGEAIVYDAAGRVGAVCTSYDAGVLTLTVADSWLEQATYPVVIDPLLSPTSVVTPTIGVSYGSVDVAWDPVHGRPLMVYTAAASATDRDVIAKLCTASLTPLYNQFSDLSTADTPYVRVACSVGSLAARYCVAYQRRTSTLILGTTLWNSEVRYHTRDTSNTGFNTLYTVISRPTGSHDWRPDVGGVLPNGITQAMFLIVYQREDSGSWFNNTANSGVRALRVDGTGAAVSTLILPGTTTGANDLEYPSVNQVARDLGGTTTDAHWLVALQERDSGVAGDVWTIVGHVVRSSLTSNYGVWINSGGSAHHRMGPQVAGEDPTQYVVAYSRSSTALVPTAPFATTGYDVYAQRVTYTSGGVPIQQPEVELVSGNVPALQVGNCSHDRDDTFWTLSYRSSAAAGGSGAGVVARLGYNLQFVEAIALPGAAISGEVEPVGLAHELGDHAWVVGWSTSGALPGDAIYLAHLTHPIVPPAYSNGPNCSGASVSWHGSQLIGSANQSVDLDAAPPGAATFLVLSTATQNLELSALGMPGCWLLVDAFGPGQLGLVIRLTDASGHASVELPLPEYLTSFTVYAQWGILAPGANPGGLVSTGRLEAFVAR